MRRLIVAFGLILILGTGWVCSACTVFSYAGDGVLLFGNSEDCDRLTPHIWFLEPTPFASLANRESSAFSTRVYDSSACIFRQVQPSPGPWNRDDAAVRFAH